MKKIIQIRFKKTFTKFLLAFIFLFVFRLFYGYQKVNEPTFLNVTHDISSYEGRKNYASKKYAINIGESPMRVDQKYEKIADINTLSTKFHEEEKLIRAQIKDFDGLIQFENKSGNKGNRRLNLVIGIPPENFDTIYNHLVKIGKIQSKQITKTDKTNEFKELNAKKASLEKIRTSLIQLKSKGGRIDEYMQLENRILDIEQQLQGLGVSLGNFDDENEFCTVKIALLESVLIKISIVQRITITLEWTFKYYMISAFVLSFTALLGYLVLLFLEKIKMKN